MKAAFIMCMAFPVLAGCSVFGGRGSAPDMTVNQVSDIRKVLEAIPAGSALEHFETLDSRGRLISYVALTDTDTGALVFVDRKFYGVLSRRDAQAFFSCRGYATNASIHWAQEAPKWTESMLESVKPVTEVKLKFSGKSVTQEARDAAGNPVWSEIRSIFSAGSNPLGLIGSLNSARGDMENSAQFKKVGIGLSAIVPGKNEASVAEVKKPESVAFVNGGMVMSYPTHMVEYFVSEGVVKVIQQPSFNFISGTHAETFYVPNVIWAFCTPQTWKEALRGK